MKQERLNCRIGQKTKSDASVRAMKQGRTLSNVVEGLLIRYVNGEVVPYKEEEITTSDTPNN